MITQSLSQFKVDPAQEETEVIVPATWLKELLSDYQKAVNEIGHLNSVIAKKSSIISSKEDRIRFLEDTSCLVRLDVKC